MCSTTHRSEVVPDTWNRLETPAERRIQHRRLLFSHFVEITPPRKASLALFVNRRRTEQNTAGIFAIVVLTLGSALRQRRLGPQAI